MYTDSRLQSPPFAKNVGGAILITYIVTDFYNGIMKDELAAKLNQLNVLMS